MKKSDRISDYVAGLGCDSQTQLHPCYQAYFTCFNAQQYYEAHDVLEHLWLQTRGADYAFFKGLIQFAGAFVHLQKQRSHPAHPKHGRRLHPAARLFNLAAQNLAPFAPRHLDLDLAPVLALCQSHAQAIAASQGTVNPWRPDDPPHFHPA